MIYLVHGDFKILQVLEKDRKIPKRKFPILIKDRSLQTIYNSIRSLICLGIIKESLEKETYGYEKYIEPTKNGHELLNLLSRFG